MRLAILAIALAACRYEGQFPCTQDVQCRIADNAGTCEQTGWCSFVDEDCTSHRRFNETAGDGFAGMCVPGPTGCETWTAHFFIPCGLPPPSGNLSINGQYVFNTTDGSLTEQLTMTRVPQPSSVIDGVRYLSVQDVTVTAQLRVTGDLPLVIAAWGSMMITGTIDAGSHAGSGGPGSNPTTCTVGTGVDATATTGGGGGGGGGFQGSGGKGGGGAAAGTSVGLPQTLRGGCSGGRSGNAVSTTFHASPGQGGGALVLAGRLSVTIDGTVAAGGEGGGGSLLGAECGGAGGGAGGMLVLDAPTLALHGQVIATGGGGGGVAQKTAAAMKGADASVTGAAGAAAGNNCSGAGGAGSSMTTPNGADGGTGTCGGAGGGGGSGWLLVFTKNLDMVGSTFAPAPSVNPF